MVVDVPFSPMLVQLFLIMKIIDGCIMYHADIETIPQGVVNGTMDGVLSTLVNQVIPNDTFVTESPFKANFSKFVNDRDQSIR